MSRKISLYLNDILKSCRKIMTYTEGMAYEVFCKTIVPTKQFYSIFKSLANPSKTSLIKFAIDRPKLNSEELLD